MIAIPGDRIKLDSGTIFLNGIEIKQQNLRNEMYKDIEVSKFQEILPNKNTYDVYEFKKNSIFIDTNNFKEFVVPEDHYFVIGDNRDNSQDSRFIGPIPKDNLVGRAEMVFLSVDTSIASLFKFWTWYPSLRKDRFFTSLVPKRLNENS